MSKKVACGIGALVGAVVLLSSAMIPMSAFLATSVQFTGLMIFIVSLVTLFVPKHM
jgi:hypothetical protein